MVTHPYREPHHDAGYDPGELDRVSPAHRNHHTPSRRGALAAAGLAVAVLSASIGGVAAVAVQPYLSTLGTVAVPPLPRPNAGGQASPRPRSSGRRKSRAKRGAAANRYGRGERTGFGHHLDRRRTDHDQQPRGVGRRRRRTCRPGTDAHRSDVRRWPHRALHRGRHGSDERYRSRAGAGRPLD